VQTACGGQIRFEQNTPTAVYRGWRVYFCLPACLEDFARDPEASCLVEAPPESDL
jgi:YHS domain-containing protein